MLHLRVIIYDVGPFSLIVALLAGAAGMLSLTSTKSAALVGVFISVTTVPAWRPRRHDAAAAWRLIG